MAAAVIQQERISPFSDPDRHSDIVFIVEEKKIYFNKGLLAISSPVFESMLNGEFAEKEQKEITLSDKKFWEIVEFFKHLHPHHIPVSSITEENLLFMLELSREYQVDSIRNKCQAYINRQATLGQRAKDMDIARVIQMLYACEEHEMGTNLPQLIKQASKATVQTLCSSALYERLSRSTVKLILETRCSFVEGIVRDVMAEVTACSGALKLIADLPDCDCASKKDGEFCCRKCSPVIAKKAVQKISMAVNKIVTGK